MTEIYDLYQLTSYLSILYSPIIGDLTFEYTYSCNGKKRIFASKQVDPKNKYMFEFDEFGRFVYLDLICEEGKRQLFKNKGEYLEYLKRKENETET